MRRGRGRGLGYCSFDSEVDFAFGGLWPWERDERCSMVDDDEGDRDVGRLDELLREETTI